MSLHVNLYECKQSHVSDIISSHRTFYMQISRNLITVSCPGKTIADIYNGIIPKIHYFQVLYINLSDCFETYKTTSL